MSVELINIINLPTRERSDIRLFSIIKKLVCSSVLLIWIEKLVFLDKKIKTKEQSVFRSLY